MDYYNVAMEEINDHKEVEKKTLDACYQRSTAAAGPRRRAHNRFGEFIGERLAAALPEWRALPYVLPAVAHGCQLAICWLLGAFAASAFEKGAYMDGWQEALRRCWRAGAFATGTLILCTQAKTYAVLSAAGLEPVLGASFEGDVAMINSVNELVVDALTQATALTAFRLYRAADAEGYDQ